MEKDESKSTRKGATDRGNKLGATCELVVSHLMCCTCVENTFWELMCKFRALKIGNLDVTK